MSDNPANAAPFRLIDDVEFGEDVTVWSFTNLYGCRIGSRTRIGSFVEVQRGASIGDSCKISSHSFICDGVAIEDEVFVGHGVLFVNDRFPRATTGEGAPKRSSRLSSVLTMPLEWAAASTLSASVCWPSRSAVETR